MQNFGTKKKENIDYGANNKELDGKLNSIKSNIKQKLIFISYTNKLHTDLVWTLNMDALVVLHRSVKELHFALRFLEKGGCRKEKVVGKERRKRRKDKGKAGVEIQE